MDKESAQVPIGMKPSIIEFADFKGYTRRLVVRGGSNSLPHVSFKDFTSQVGKIFSCNAPIRMIYKRGRDQIVIVESEMEFEAACSDIMPGQSLRPVVFEHLRSSGNWYKLNPGQSADKTAYPEL